MTDLNKNPQHGSILTNTLLVIVLIIIGILIYIMAGGDMPKIGRTSGVDGITVTQTSRAPEFAPTQNGDGIFSDGLNKPNSEKKFSPNEFGEGKTNVAEFNVDINNDGRMDKITRTHMENGTAHGWDEYKIELNKDGRMENITPKGFRTTDGAECALQKLQFSFNPDFKVTKISRPWVDSWSTPSTATKTTYKIENNKLIETKSQQIGTVCDVTELF